MAILIFLTAGDGQRAQNNLINNLNANYGVLPSIQNGFCFILVTEWLIEFLGHPRNPHNLLDNSLDEMSLQFKNTISTEGISKITGNQIKII